MMAEADRGSMEEEEEEEAGVEEVSVLSEVTTVGFESGVVVTNDISEVDLVIDDCNRVIDAVVDDDDDDADADVDEVVTEDGDFI